MQNLLKIQDIALKVHSNSKIYPLKGNLNLFKEESFAIFEEFLFKRKESEELEFSLRENLLINGELLIKVPEEFFASNSYQMVQDYISQDKQNLDEFWFKLKFENDVYGEIEINDFLSDGESKGIEDVANHL